MSYSPPVLNSILVLPRHRKTFKLLSVFQLSLLFCSLFSFLMYPQGSVKALTFTVTNTQDSGAGSLRQAILDLNAQCPAGTNTIVFNIPASEPVAASDSTNGKVVYAGGTYFRIVPQSKLPSITCSGSIIDATTQTAFGGDTNPGQEGASGTVGVDGVTLSKVNKPEIEIKAGFIQPATQTYGIEAGANNVTIKGLAIFGFGKPNESGDLGSVCCSGLTVEQNFIGSPASGFVDPGASARGQANGVYLENHKNAIIKNNLIGFHDMTGVFIRVGDSSGNLIEKNEIRNNNRAQNLSGPGIGITDSTNVDGIIIRHNLIIGQDATSGGSSPNEYADFGIEITASATGRITIDNNTLTQNGSGAVLAGSSSSTFSKNLVYSNNGKGLIVQGPKNTVTRNSFYANDNSPANNTSLAIDLDPDYAGVTQNDANDADVGGNSKFNFPVLDTAQISGTNLSLTGFARPASLIELFIADPDPSGFGEGKTYLTTLTEGSAQDLDSSTGAYGPGNINNLTQGQDTTNRFSFTLALSSLAASVTSGTILTATATDGEGSTSEFSGNLSVSVQAGGGGGGGGGGGVVNSVDAVNDAVSTTQNIPVTINVFANDLDPQGDAFTLTTPLIQTQTSNGRVVCNAQGYCVYTPNSGFTGTDSFSYTIIDSKGAVDTATVTITIPGASVNVTLQVGLVNGHVFFDLDNDGVQDVSDENAANLEVVVTDTTGVKYSVYTDAFGDFQATIPAGQVSMNLVLDTAPLSGYQITTESSGGARSQSLVLASGDVGTFDDIGLYNPTGAPVVTPTPTTLQPATAGIASNIIWGIIFILLALSIQVWKSKNSYA